MSLCKSVPYLPCVPVGQDQAHRGSQGLSISKDCTLVSSVGRWELGGYAEGCTGEVETWPNDEYWKSLEPAKTWPETQASHSHWEYLSLLCVTWPLLSLLTKWTSWGGREVAGLRCQSASNIADLQFKEEQHWYLLQIKGVGAGTEATRHLDTSPDLEKGFLMPTAWSAIAALVPGLFPGYLARAPGTCSCGAHTGLHSSRKTTSLTWRLSTTCLPDHRPPWHGPPHLAPCPRGCSAWYDFWLLLEWPGSPLPNPGEASLEWRG